MAGRPKQGIDYAGWSVNIFDGDTKIDKLLDAQGWVGFSIYFYLCQMAYKFDGYFYRWAYDDSASTARRMGGGIGSGTVEETVRYCLQIGLFDRRLFDEWNILTSRGIQRRFLAAIQGRRVKSVISDYWLLNDEESGGLEKCVSNDDFRNANSHLQGADDHLQGADSPKSKVKERKENTPPTPSRGCGVASAPKYQPEWFDRFWALYPRKTNREASVRAWDRLRPDLELCRVMDRAIRIQMGSAQWQDKQHIPHPSTWLNGKRWMDELGEEGAPPPPLKGPRPYHIETIDGQQVVIYDD